MPKCDFTKVTLVCENLKKFKNISKVSKLDGNIVLCPASFPEIKLFQNLRKTHPLFALITPSLS